MKLNLLEKDETYGPQYISLNLETLDKVGFKHDPATIDKIAEGIKNGHYFFELEGSGGTLVYMSKKVDGLTRDIDAYVAEFGWNRSIRLNNLQPDPTVWASDVDKWFAYAMDCQEYKDGLNSLCEAALNLPPKSGNKPFKGREMLEEAKQWIKDQVGDSKWSTGSRPEKIADFLTNWVLKKVHFYRIDNDDAFRKKFYAKYHTVKWSRGRKV